MITKAIFYHDFEKRNDKLELTAELAPCPFCGGEAEARYSPGAYGITGIKVRCTKCHISTFTEFIGCGRYSNGHFVPVTEAEAFNIAVTTWNRRTTV